MQLLMPLHIAQMNKLQKTDPEIWESLKSGDFVVSKSGIPFSSLFTDQVLEQEIKNLKRYGGIVGISQNEDALDRMMYATPHLSKIVRSYLQRFSNDPGNVQEHYQLKGIFATLLNENALKLQQTLLVRCDGNPYTTGVPLKSIVSSAIIPEKAINHILNLTKYGEKRHEEFALERLLLTSTKSTR